jgi:hypothetical protein
VSIVVVRDTEALSVHEPVPSVPELVHLAIAFVVPEPRGRLARESWMLLVCVFEESEMWAFATLSAEVIQWREFAARLSPMRAAVARESKCRSDAKESWIRANVYARCADIESVRNETSPGKKARKPGTPLEPFGDMNAWFAACDEKLAAMAPEVVIGPPVTVNTELGKVTLTEETPPPPPPPMLNRTARLSAKTCVETL